jgi:hypothetical protein
VIIHTPTSRLVFRSDTTGRSPTTTTRESRVAMKIPTVVTVRTTHLYSKRNRHTTSSIFPGDQKNQNINSGQKIRKTQTSSAVPRTTEALNLEIFKLSRSRPAEKPLEFENLGWTRPFSALFSNPSPGFLEHDLPR